MPDKEVSDEAYRTASRITSMFVRCATSPGGPGNLREHALDTSLITKVARMIEAGQEPAK